MVYILQKLIGYSISNSDCLIGRDNSPIRSTEAVQLIGYSINNYESLVGYNIEGGGYTI